jgi:hypothetical protein
MEVVAYPVGSYMNRASLVNRVVDSLEAEYRPTHVLLDGEDYTHADTVLEEFQDIAFYWNRERPINRVPSHVLALMENPDCHHLVWLSRKAIEEEEDILFTWILVHELRHIYQAKQNLSLQVLRREAQNLRCHPKYRGLPSGPMNPAELDSDIFAMRACEALFGMSKVDEFIARRRLPRCPFVAYPAYLRDLELLWNKVSQ